MRCKAHNKAGNPCQAHAMTNGYCYRHNPEISAEAKLEASRRGGSKLDPSLLNDTAAPIDASSIEGMLAAVTKNINDLRTGKIDARTSNALIQNMIALIELHKIEDLDARVTKIEQQLSRGGV